MIVPTHTWLSLRTTEEEEEDEEERAAFQVQNLIAISCVVVLNVGDCKIRDDLIFKNRVTSHLWEKTTRSRRRIHGVS